MAREIIIVGAGGHGRVCADVAEAAGFVISGFADHNHELGDLINGYQCVANSFEDLQEHCKPEVTDLFIAITDNQLRESIYRKAGQIGFAVPTLIHPTAVISKHAKIGRGTVVMPGVVVNANAVVGEYCILNTGCRIDYDVSLADGVQISPGASIAGGVSIGAKSFIGTGAGVIPNIVIGNGCLIGACAAVTKHVGHGERVAGVPAKPIRL